jgi:hypothetical protein
MKNKVQLILTFATLVWGCNGPSKKASDTKDTLTNPKITQPLRQDTLTSNKEFKNFGISGKWTDSLLNNYILRTKNELIRLAIKSKLSEEWLFDQMVETDTAKYYSFRIGHDEADKGETNPRFVTDQWIYIDSLTKKVYEYGIANDSLVLWTK